ncbi:MAG: DUF58 domain-containing protein [Phycisphaeraceae bacterium]|nr:DUF58 domain-containing protein [Phycisphaeraceae bacterium]
MALPTPRLILLFVIPAVIAVLAGPNLGFAVVMGCSGLLLALAVCDAFLAPNRRSLVLKPVQREQLSLNEWNAWEIEVINQADRDLTILIRVDLPLHLKAREDPLAIMIKPHSRATARIDLMPMRRGLMELGNLTVRVSGPLGLVTRQITYRHRAEIRIYPSIESLRRFELQVYRHERTEIGKMRSRFRGHGGEFDSLREYVPGDPTAAIAWKASARRGKLMTRDFQVERSQNLLIMLDCGRLMTTMVGELSRLDYAIQASLLLAHVAARQGDRVGLIGFSDKIECQVPASRGRAAVGAIYEALYRLEPRLRESDYDAACRFLSLRHRRRSLIVFFTDVIDSITSDSVLAHTMRFARHHLPVCVTFRHEDLLAIADSPPRSSRELYRQAVGMDLLDARNEALLTMKRNGVDVLDVSPRSLNAEVVQKYLDIKRRMRL